MSTLPTRFRRNALANYANSFVTLALALIVTPILVRGLGKEAYGTWVLVTSLVLYFDLLKFGFSKAAIKYVAEGNAIGDLDRVRRTIATSCAALSVPGLALMLAAPGLAFLFPMLFHVSPNLKHAAMILVALSVIDLAVAIPADTFGSALSGFQRFELLNATLTATALAQAVAWTVIVALGGGLIAVGVAGVSLSLLSQVARYLIVRHLCGVPPLRRRYVDRALFKPLVSMSGWIALTDFAEFVIGGLDPIVVGLIAGVPQAGVYAVGSKLAALTERFTTPLLTLFFPHASELSTSGEKESIRATLIAGTRIAVAVATPLTIVLGVLARPAIRSWVGPSFGDAALVVVFLSTTALVYAVAQTGVLVLRGLGDVKFPARINLFEAVVNLSLSVALCKTIGIKGVALGTLIAAVLTQLMILLPYICRRTGVRFHSLIVLLARQFLLPAALALGVGLLLLATGLSGIVDVILAGVAILVAYAAIAVITALSAAERRALLDYLRKRKRGRLAQ
jgi:O-antigen/teichoic acid export membrane protein